MTVAIRIAGIAHTPLATHPRVASPHDSPSAEGGGSYRRGLVIVSITDAHHASFMLSSELELVSITLIPPHSRASSCFPFYF
jgi:hypothetical protein